MTSLNSLLALARKSNIERPGVSSINNSKLLKLAEENNKLHDVPITMSFVEKNITAGTSATTFSPNMTCTRGQIATFLWRGAGQPEPAGKNNPFTDVKTGDYFYKAVLWAVENGITNGTSTTNPRSSSLRPSATAARSARICC